MKYFLILSLLFLSACAETEFGAHIAKNVGSSGSKGAYKVGNPYLVEGQEYRPQENFNYTETGIASWYGPGFHGKKTANGEWYDSSELTAAHRTLQMPSLVRVTNLDNGRSVVLRVNDRGPFSRGRIIDVSSKAADLLAFKGRGTARVRVETLPAESRQIAEHAKAGRDTRGYEVALNGNRRPTDPAQPVMLYPQQTAMSVQTSTPIDTLQPAQVASVESVPLEASRAAPVPGHIAPDGRFMPSPVVTHHPVVSTNIYIQAGAFSDQANAQRLSDTLTTYGTARVYPTTINGQSFYRVRLGPYASVAQADATLGSLMTDVAPKAVIVVE